MEHLVFLTGRLAEPALRRVLEGIERLPFSWEVREIGLQVAGLMTADMIRRRVTAPVESAPGAVHWPEGAEVAPALRERARRADRVIVPGRCRGDLEALHEALGVPVERGPEELKDLPRHFNRGSRPVDLSEYEVAIFAEIVDAPRLDIAQIVERALQHRRDGADVIDLGSLPATPFPHLEDAVRALKAEGFQVSVDAVEPDDLLRGGRAGADYLLSLNADTLWIADEVASTPILIPRTPSDEASLDEAIAGMQRRGRHFIADAILDPIPFGFTQSVMRYGRLRERHPEVAIMVGVGNVTELTEADTSGLNALLFGICAELDAAAVLTTQVSAHARRAIREADWARRIMHAARRQQSLPKGLSDALMTVHAKHPFPDSPEEIAAVAAQVKDPNFRVQVSAEGLHVYNRDGMRRGLGAFELWPQLGLEHDAAHAFYMGVELAHAELAHKLGKRYTQDQPLDWGAALDRPAESLDAWCAPGTTMKTTEAPMRPEPAASHKGSTKT